MSLKIVFLKWQLYLPGVNELIKALSALCFQIVKHSGEVSWKLESWTKFLSTSSRHLKASSEILWRIVYETKVCSEEFSLCKREVNWTHYFISMGWCKKDVTPLLTHWSYVFLHSPIDISILGPGQGIDHYNCCVMELCLCTKILL